MKTIIASAAMALCLYNPGASTATPVSPTQRKLTEHTGMRRHTEIASQFEWPEPPVQGDLNGDGTLNILDILEVIINLGCSEMCGNADVNGDGLVSVHDLQLLLRWL